ncbi:ImmA/IrrE family metallo-endopeptidase [Micromonospora sp. C51]|uniref:ImmA/IrrE family metallo-endopeptidase n=1 Tax=Micromonospora sp. C51 TaxID=2824879 RepID=UPI001B377AF8|nr:ImmA/IrrE family metallo-endopeptidase [Micromonospora sp. C51]MBQ1052899.1 ImmA/IrrE family metallo-endopeptidase [Micromonospora sp. C51]
MHRDLGIDRTGYVDVFAALRAAGVDCLTRPMPKLFGFYFGPDDSGPAVLLNASLDEIGLRHTAAHELGHHAFDHGSRADADLDIAGLHPRRMWTAVEMQAESFAAWFLMPPPAVDAALRRIGIEQVQQPEEAYEVARWLGTSYAGTVRHLGRLKKIHARAAASWPRVPPQRLRARLHRPTLEKPASHLFLVRPPARGAVLHVAAGDLLLLPPGARITHLPDGLVAADSDARPAENAVNGVPESDGRAGLTVEVTERFRRSSAISFLVPGHDLISVTVVAPVRRLGAADAWSCANEPDRPRTAHQE